MTAGPRQRTAIATSAWWPARRTLSPQAFPDVTLSTTEIFA